jgi:PilZ domain
VVTERPKSPAFRDNRRAKRQLMRYPAWLLIGASRQPVECIIRDMSDTGARIALGSQIKALPNRFTLWLDKTGKVQRQCSIMWAHGGYVGVRFEGRSPPR